VNVNPSQYTQNIPGNNPAIRPPPQYQGPRNVPIVPMNQANLMQAGPTQMLRYPNAGGQVNNSSPNSTFIAGVAPIPITRPQVPLAAPPIYGGAASLNPYTQTPGLGYQNPGQTYQIPGLNIINAPPRYYQGK
jgi:hypothetical protein